MNFNVLYGKYQAENTSIDSACAITKPIKPKYLTPKYNKATVIMLWIKFILLVAFILPRAKKILEKILTITDKTTPTTITRFIVLPAYMLDPTHRETND